MHAHMLCWCPWRAKQCPVTYDQTYDFVQVHSVHSKGICLSLRIDHKSQRVLTASSLFCMSLSICVVTVLVWNTPRDRRSDHTVCNATYILGPGPKWVPLYSAPPLAHRSASSFSRNSICDVLASSTRNTVSVYCSLPVSSKPHGNPTALP